MSRIPLRTLLTAGLALALLLGACSDDDTSSETADETAAEGQDSAAQPAGTTEPPTTSEAAGQPIDTIAVEDSVLAIIDERDDLTTFAAAAEALGTPGVFTQERGVTILAPSDDAFAELGEDELDAILEDPEALAALVSAHVAVGVSTTDTLADSGELTNASAQTLTVEVDGDTITIGGATIIEGDLTADNGVVHIVDTVLVSSG